MKKTPYIAAVLPTSLSKEESARVDALRKQGLARVVAFKAKLKVSRWLERYCAQAAGNARWMWNHLVKLYEAKTEENPSWRFLWQKERTDFDNGERKNHPWLLDVCADSYKEVFRDFSNAVERYRSDLFDKTKAPSKKMGKPRLHKKKHKLGSFRMNGTRTGVAMGVHGLHSSNKYHYLRIPGGEKWSPNKDRWVKICEAIPVNPLQVLNVTITLDGDDIYASLCMVVMADDYRRLQHSANEAVRIPAGLDWGIKRKATVSTQAGCAQIGQHKTPQRKEVHVKRQQRKLERKVHPRDKKDCQNGVKASNRYRKEQLKLRALIHKITNQRVDHERKAVSAVTRSCCAVGVEDTNNSGLLKNHNVARAIANASPYRFIQWLKWKALWRDVLVVVADPFYPSTQRCSSCGHVRTGEEKLQLKDRVYTCPACGFTADRDANAGLNLLSLALEEMESFKPAAELSWMRNHLGGATADDRKMRADLTALLGLLAREGLATGGNL